MLGPSGYCRLPSTPLQPYAPAVEIDLPMDGILANPVVPGYLIKTGENYLKVIFLVNYNVWGVMDSAGAVRHRAWRDAAGTWRTGSHAQWMAIKNNLTAAQQVKRIQLPLLPVLPHSGSILPIPKNIHFIWLGNSVPKPEIIDNIANNVRLSSGYLSTLHVDIQSPEVLARIRESFRLAAPDLVISELRSTPFFDEFMGSYSYTQYQNVMAGPGKNFSAASDVLRYRLTNYYGGIYMDVDDAFKFDISDIEFRAASNDLLLGPKVSEEMAGFSGYNSSIFASHPNNPILSEISKEMQERYRQSGVFFDRARPRVDEDGALMNPAEATMDMPAYATELFRLTGPKVLNDVLAIERPDYYRLCFTAEEGADISATYHVWDERYVKQHFELIDHYFPFSSRADVAIGHEHSWFST